MRKRVYIAATGGTIAMRRTAAGYDTEPGFLAELLAKLPELQAPEMPDYTLHEYDPLLDSSNMTPRDWWRIAQDLEAQYDDYDGFVVLHGTDTMAYTASALPFFLEGLGKPVIVTGSQIPLCEIRNDARANLLASLLIAANEPIPEVCLFFGDKLLRGCRAVKVDADGLAAFDSPNYPPLGEAGTDLEIHWNRVRPAPAPETRFRVREVDEVMIGALRLFPGIPAEFLKNVLRPPLKGLVLEAYGVGNGPDRDPAFLAALAEAIGRGVVIVDTTQCLRGKVDLADYATGAALAKAGVVSGHDLTAEAALAKLYYLFSVGLPPEEVKNQVGRDLRGELTTG
jgi:L-asparaginase